MDINLKRFAKGVVEKHSNIDFEVEYDDQSVTLSASIGAERFFDDHIRLVIYLNKNQLIRVTFVFDKVDKTLNVYNLINKFNENTIYKGYITDSDYFQVDVKEFGVKSAEDALVFFFFYLDSLLEDNTMYYLAPILKITK